MDRGINLFGDIPIQYCTDIPVLDTEVDFNDVLDDIKNELKIIKEILAELNGKIERI